MYDAQVKINHLHVCISDPVCSAKDYETIYIADQYLASLRIYYVTNDLYLELVNMR